MRSIIKADISGNKALNRPESVVVQKPQAEKPKKVVRFDDMILIADDNEQVQLFLSDEEASIIEKKATPTKLNMQSSAELRKRLRKEKAEKLLERTNAKAQKANKPEEMTLDQVLDRKRRRVQTQIYGQEPTSTTSDSGRNTKATASPDEDDRQGECEAETVDAFENDCSYDGDSDVASGRHSKIKHRRSGKTHRKEQRK